MLTLASTAVLPTKNSCVDVRQKISRTRKTGKPVEGPRGHPLRDNGINPAMTPGTLDRPGSQDGGTL